VSELLSQDTGTNNQELTAKDNDKGQMTKDHGQSRSHLVTPHVLVAQVLQPLAQFFVVHPLP